MHQAVGACKYALKILVFLLVLWYASTRAMADAALNRTAVASRARERSLEYLRLPLTPADSWDELTTRCGGGRQRQGGIKRDTLRRPILAARVPKTGSTAFLSGLVQACNTSAADPLWDHQAIAPLSCQRASLATVREPCARLVSSFRHLKRAMTLSYANAHCRHTPNRCTGHWVHGVHDADGFVAAVRSRWSELLGYPLSLTRRTGVWARGFVKHEVVLLPQTLWIGNFSLVTCTPSIGEELPRLARAMGCSNVSAVDAAAAVVAAVNAHQPSDESFELSPDGCRAARALYARDTELWQRHCVADP